VNDAHKHQTGGGGQTLQYQQKMGSHTFVLDSAVEIKHWLHPADAVTIKEAAGNEEASVQA